MILADVNLLVYEHNCELHSTDKDFDKFAGLRWRNPLVPASV